MYEGYPEEMQKTLNRLDELKIQVIKRLPHLITALETKVKFENLEIQVSLDWWGDVKILIGFVKNLQEIAPVLKWLAKRGYNQKYSKENNPRSNSISYYFENLQMEIVFSKEEESCKFVQTGTKLEEKPIYELQCD